jgi:hypothetical protein
MTHAFDQFPVGAVIAKPAEYAVHQGTDPKCFDDNTQI